MLAQLRSRERIIYTIVGAIFLFGMGFVGSRRMQSSPPIQFESQSPSVGGSKILGDAKEVVVHVIGAVKSPGVYHFKPGARIEDALKVAGGATEKANLDAVNLAAKLDDAAQIRIPLKGEVVTPPVTPVATDPPAESPRHGKKIAPPLASVDLNHATIEDLTQIPGIGNSTAQKILDLRSQKGSFKSIDELREISGLAGKRFDSIRVYFRI